MLELISNRDELHLRAPGAPRQLGAGLGRYPEDHENRPAVSLQSVVARRLGGATRACVLVHGYDFDPLSGGGDDPFHLVYAPAGAALARRSWREFIDPAGYDARAIVAFGWLSTGDFSTFASSGYDQSYRYAHKECAVPSARCLAATLRALQGAGVTGIDIVAHSLGTRVVIQAFKRLMAIATLPLRLVLLLGGAEYVREAKQGMVDVRAHVVNVAARGDKVLDWLAESFGAFHDGVKAQVIGHNGLKGVARWTDIQLDGAPLQGWIATDGRYPGLTASPAGEDTDQSFDAHLKHWGYYSNPANHALYTDLLRGGPEALKALRDAGLPTGVRVRFVD